MTKVEKADAIAKALEHVPIPMVSTAATLADAILGIIEADRNLNLSVERSWMQQVAAAEQPWQQILQTAESSS